MPVGKNPGGVAVDPGTHTVYVTDFTTTPASAPGTVSVIDASTVTATVPVGNGPVDLAVDPGTHTVYVTNFNASTVSVIEHR